jgi:hypothetical protein
MLQTVGLRSKNPINLLIQPTGEKCGLVLTSRASASKAALATN